jgi:long-chain acyl-CoA synthetase
VFLVTTYADRPWLALYSVEEPADVAVEHDDALAMARATIAARPDDPAVEYFDGSLTWREIDALSTAFAAGLRANGFNRGDRLAVYLQNVPQFVVAMLATWKAGGILVSVNPMNRERELAYQLKDSGARILVCLESLYDAIARTVVPDSDVRLVLTTSELEYQTLNDPRLFEAIARTRHEGTVDLPAFIEQYRGEAVPEVSYGVDCSTSPASSDTSASASSPARRWSWPTASTQRLCSTRSAGTVRRSPSARSQHSSRCSTHRAVRGRTSPRSATSIPE